MCSDKLLKKIGSKISRKLTPKKKNSKFIREETIAPLGLAIILLIFTSNIKNNAILYNNNKLQTYIPEIVIDTEDAFVRTTLHIKDLNGSGVSKAESQESNISTTSDSATSDLSTIDID
ncbi:hypothetical protein C2G38_2227026 [Gigaspora rosea]|uniref:Uncharacterized protein n=1 Tax=Gigaspora rosea TaxID=44941 RepID=A0A397TZA3_9GLOM|nr:hypothetical protein C2G38_2227026 [Gigaspora rosea]